ncbi:MAG: hypothetical protein KAI18_00165 [Candidatus Aenigmarchaeota archaeon]|nr:hypothetical protein [Candidatus Aenigmarchaeota archaeon]
MSVTITFEKKHFLMAGIIIALPFMILAISNIFAATTMPIVGHPISELYVDSDLDMGGNAIINSGNISISGSENGIVFPDGSVQKTAVNKSTYNVFGKCTGCTASGGSSVTCTPSDETADLCPVGWIEVYFAKHDTDFNALGSLYTNPGTVTDTTLTAGYRSVKHAGCGVTVNVVDVYGGILDTQTSSRGGLSNGWTYCAAWCSYRICQQN